MSFIARLRPVARLRDATRVLLTAPDRARRLLFGVVIVWLVGGTLAGPATSHGDGGEYLLMSESLLRHATPEVRPGDVQSLAGRERRHPVGLGFGAVLGAYFDDGGGRWYCYHFWGYSLMTVPARAVLRVLGLDDRKGAQVTNALLFLLAFHQILFAARLAAPVRRGLGLLFLFSPVLWFIPWPHPEVASASLVMLTLVWIHAGRAFAPVLAAALAAMQNPPLLLLVAFAWTAAVIRVPGPRWRALLLASLAAFPSIAPFLFYQVTFGMPSILAHRTASAALLSWPRALGLLFDANIGLLPYMPLTTALALGCLALAVPLGLRAFARAWLLAGAFLLMAFACTATGNWNHGTSGPSRYAVWLAPLVLWLVTDTHDALQRRGGRPARVASVLVALAALTQGGVVAARGGLHQPEDDLEHSYLARVLLRHAPRLYNPPPEIFVARTLHEWYGRESPGQSALYQDETGCRKAWARRHDRQMLLDACGRLPPGSEPFFQPSAQRQGRRYLDY